MASRGRRGKKKSRTKAKGRCRVCQHEDDMADWYRTASPRCPKCGGLMDRLFLPSSKNRKGWIFNPTVFPNKSRDDG